MHWESAKVAGRPNEGKRGRPTDRQAPCEQGEDRAKRHTRIVGDVRAYSATQIWRSYIVCDTAVFWPSCSNNPSQKLITQNHN